MAEETAVPGIARELIELLEAYEHREVLRRLDEPRDGGAIPAPIAGLLRSRALASGERFFAAYEVLNEVRAMRDLSAMERVEAQMRTARVLRFASPLVDYALDMARAAAQSAFRVGKEAWPLAVDARVEAALLFARKRCQKLAEQQLDIARDLEVCPARISAARADLALQFDERVKAKEAFDATLAHATALPDGKEKDEAMRYARLGLARLHTVLGEFDDAERHLDAYGRRPPGDVATLRARYRLHASRAKWDEVADVLGTILEAAPDGDYARAFMLERAAALYRAGNLAGAREAWTKIATSAQDDVAKTAARLLDKSANEGARRKHLEAFPSVAQLRNHCGPASVELCMRFFGVSADQVAVAREIKHPDGGTPVHKMRWYLDRAGFITRRIEADLTKLRAILDAGVPVIVEEDYSTTRHVAVAVGYDDRREILEVQDPMTHEVRETPYEELAKLREFSNHGALVAVPRGREDLLAKLDAAGAVECAYMTKTDQAWQARDQARHDEGDKLIEEAIALHEPYELAWVYKFLRARDLYTEDHTGERKTAVTRVLGRILELWPEDEWPQQFLGRFDMMEERWADALHAFERARDRDPDDSNNWCSIGDCHIELGDKAAARKAFEQALQRDPSHVRSNENLANLVFEAGELSVAELLNECALELSEDNPFNHHVRGRILAKKSEPRRAVAAYDRAMELRPGFGPYVIERAKLLAKCGDVDVALASLRKLSEERKTEPHPLVELADLAYVHDRLDESIAACEALLGLDPESATARAIGGAARCKKGDLDAGLPMLREALARRPTYAWVHREMGRALAKAERWQDAIAAYAAAAGLMQGPATGFDLGDVLARAGRPADGASYLRRAAGSGELDAKQLQRVADVLYRAEGAGSAHGFFEHIGQEHPRDPAIAHAHAHFLLETIWAPRAAGPVLSRLSELDPEDPFVLAKSADDLMDASMATEPQGLAIFARAIEKGHELVYPRRMLARQQNARGRFEDALAFLEPCPADSETMEDRVHAMLGLRREAAANAAIDAWIATLPEDQRARSRRPLDYKIAQVARRHLDALTIAEALSADEGELADDGELGRWEIQRFEQLVHLQRREEAYEFGVAQCADASDRGRLAFGALNAGDRSLAKQLAEEALEDDEDEDYSLHVMARVADHEGDVERATELWEHLGRVSSWHIYKENLGRLALAAGDLARAHELFEGAVATGHTCPVALQFRAELRVLEGDREGARADAERASGCLQLEERETQEDLAGLVAALDGKLDEARRLYDVYMSREALAPSDRARFVKIREALGC